MQKFNNETEFVLSNEFVGFTTIPNFILNDKNISYKALGIYVQILQYQNSPDHKIYIKSLQQLKKDGRDAVAAGIKELVDAGYLKKEQLRDNQGKIIGIRYTVFMKPSKTITLTDNGKSVSGDDITNNETETGKSVIGKSDFGKSVTYNKNKDKNKIGKNENQSIFHMKIDRQTFNTEESLQLKSIKDTINFEVLKENRPTDTKILTNIESIIEDMFYSSRVKINGEFKPQSIIRSTLSKLQEDHIEAIIGTYKEISKTSKIKNVAAYMKTMIYMSVLDANLKIENDILYNMGI